MAGSIRITLVGILTVLFLGLFVALRQAMMQTTSEPVFYYQDGEGIQGLQVTQMALSNLETFLKEVLEKVRNGEAISHGREQALKDIRQALVEHLADRPDLLSKLLAIIDEILLLNDELIYPDDGERRTDDDR